MAPWLVVVPGFDGGQQQEQDQQGDEDQVRYQAPEQTAEDGSGNGGERHGDDEGLALPEHGEALVTAEAGSRDEHGRQ